VLCCAGMFEVERGMTIDSKYQVGMDMRWTSDTAISASACSLMLLDKTWIGMGANIVAWKAEERRCYHYALHDSAKITQCEPECPGDYVIKLKGAHAPLDRVPCGCYVTGFWT
jgi:hypothetical protein